MGPEEIPLILHGDCLREGHYCFLEQGGLTQEGRYPWAWGGHRAAGRKDLCPSQRRLIRIQSLRVRIPIWVSPHAPRTLCLPTNTLPLGGDIL